MPAAPRARNGEEEVKSDGPYEGHIENSDRFVAKQIRQALGEEYIVVPAEQPRTSAPHKSSVDEGKENATAFQCI